MSNRFKIIVTSSLLLFVAGYLASVVGDFAGVHTAHADHSIDFSEELEKQPADQMCPEENRTDSENLKVYAGENRPSSYINKMGALITNLSYTRCYDTTNGFSISGRCYAPKKCRAIYCTNLTTHAQVYCRSVQSNNSPSNVPTFNTLSPVPTAFQSNTVGINPEYSSFQQSLPSNTDMQLNPYQSSNQNALGQNMDQDIQRIKYENTNFSDVVKEELQLQRSASQFLGYTQTPTNIQTIQLGGDLSTNIIGPSPVSFSNTNNFTQPTFSSFNPSQQSPPPINTAIDMNQYSGSGYSNTIYGWRLSDNIEDVRMNTFAHTDVSIATLPITTPAPFTPQKVSIDWQKLQLR